MAAAFWLTGDQPPVRPSRWGSFRPTVRPRQSSTCQVSRALTAPRLAAFARTQAFGVHVGRSGRAPGSNLPRNAYLENLPLVENRNRFGFASTSLTFDWACTPNRTEPRVCSPFGRKYCFGMLAFRKGCIFRGENCHGVRCSLVWWQSQNWLKVLHTWNSGFEQRESYNRNVRLLCTAVRASLWNATMGKLHVL